MPLRGKTLLFRLWLAVGGNIPSKGKITGLTQHSVNFKTDSNAIVSRLVSIQLF
jgi:hypothetical protein